MLSPTETKPWMSLKEAAEMLGVHPATLRRWADQGEIAHMFTPGGHRRFANSDIERFTEERRQGATKSGLEHAWAESALHHARSRIVARQDEQWLAAFDGEDRERKRILGRRLMGLLMQYIALDGEGEEILAEAQAIGREHAWQARELGLSLSTTIEATQFFQNTLVEVAFDLPESMRVQPQMGKRLIGRINRLLGAVQLAMVEAYEQ